MATKITVRRVGGFLSKPTEVFLLVAAFLSLNFYLLSTVEQRFVREMISLNKSGGEHKSILKKATDIQDQVITLEEDGRFGNLLLETATLLLIGKKLNKRVQLLPQVGKKLKNYFSSLPAETIDYTKVNLYYAGCESLAYLSLSNKLNHQKLLLHNFSFLLRMKYHYYIFSTVCVITVQTAYVPNVINGPKYPHGHTLQIQKSSTPPTLCSNGLILRWC